MVDGAAITNHDPRLSESEARNERREMLANASLLGREGIAASGKGLLWTRLGYELGH